MPSKFKRKPGRSKWVDPAKFPQHLPVVSYKGCSRKIEVCKPMTECRLPNYDKDTGKYLGTQLKHVEKAIYIIRDCKPGMQRDCVFMAREMAEGVLAEKCKVPKLRRPCAGAKPYVAAKKR